MSEGSAGRRLVLVVVSGAAAALAFPDVGLSLLAFVAYAPFLWALRGCSPWQGAVLGYVFGLAYFLVGVAWLAELHVAGLIALTVIVAVFPALFGLLAPWMWTWPRAVRIPGLAALWTLCDYLRSFVFDGFPFLFPAHALYEWTMLIQLADVAGAYGVGFLVVLVDACVAEAWLARREPRRRAPIRPVAVAAIVVLAMVGYGAVRLPAIDLRPGPRFLVVQPNFSQGDKHGEATAEQIYRKQLGMTLEALDRSGPVDVVVWAETMFPWTLIESRADEYRSAIELLEGLARRTGAALFAGASVIGDDTVSVYAFDRIAYNSVLAIDRSGSLLGRYDKRRLVPTGEYIPLRAYLPFRRAIEGFIEGVNGFFPNIATGSGPKVFSVSGSFGEVLVTPLVCYELLFSDLPRDGVRLGAGVILNLSNDGWFQESAQLEQSVGIAVFRAIECRTPVVRATNSGISLWIDARGRIRERLVVGGEDRSVEGTLVADVDLTDVTAPAVSAGDRPAWMVGLAGLAIALLAPLRRRLRRPRDPAASA